MFMCLEESRYQNISALGGYMRW